MENLNRIFKNVLKEAKDPTYKEYARHLEKSDRIRLQNLCTDYGNVDHWLQKSEYPPEIEAQIKNIIPEMISLLSKINDFQYSEFKTTIRWLFD